MPTFDRFSRREPRFVLQLVSVACAIIAPIACAGQPVTAASGKWLALSMDPGSPAACGITNAGAVALLELLGAGPGEQSALMKFGSLQNPRVVPNIDRAVGVAVAETFACAWNVRGEVWCWGANDSGQLGDSTLVSRAEPHRVHARVAAAHVGVSSDGYACLLSTEGRAYCWGSGRDGQLGQGRTDGPILVPTPVAGEHQFKSISVGPDSHVCAIDGNGAVWCWGDNGSGQVSASTTQGNVHMPTRIDAEQRFDQVASGNSFTCALSVGGQASCWGYNRDASLGVGDTAAHSSVQLVRTTEKFLSISAGFRWTCGTTSSLHLVCWGMSDEGHRVALPAPVPQGGGRLTEMAIGGRATCVLDRDGTIRCWTRARR